MGNNKVCAVIVFHHAEFSHSAGTANSICWKLPTSHLVTCAGAQPRAGKDGKRCTVEERWGKWFNRLEERLRRVRLLKVRSRSRDSVFLRK